MQKGTVPILWFNSNAKEAVSHPQFEKALTRLAALGKEAVKARYKKEGTGLHCLGVQMGDIRKLAKEVGTDHGSDHDLALALWDSPVLEARLLAALLDRIELEMATAAPPQQWTMNFCLAAIGDHHG